MTTSFCQRWRDGRTTYRPSREVVQTRTLDVAPVDEATARAFVEQHHYSRSYPAARRRFGLFQRGDLVGVCVVSVPMAAAVLTSVYDAPPAECGEIGRFVLLDAVGANAESWFLARVRCALRREGWAGLVSHADPVPRPAPGGTVVAGHVGTIYQASNALYLGRTTARTLRLLPDGRVFSDRAASKVRRREQGHAYASAQLVDAGAAPLSGADDAGAWMALWLPRVTRPLRHGGNHRYAFPLHRHALRRGLTALPYPKAASGLFAPAEAAR